MKIFIVFLLGVACAACDSSNKQSHKENNKEKFKKLKLEFINESLNYYEGKLDLAERVGADSTTLFRYNTFIRFYSEEKLRTISEK